MADSVKQQEDATTSPSSGGQVFSGVAFFISHAIFEGVCMGLQAHLVFAKHVAHT